MIDRIIRLCVIVCFFSFSSKAQEIKSDSVLTVLIASYEEALNSQNTAMIKELFTEDAVLVLQSSSTCVGIESIEYFYNELFQFVNFDLKFNIAEVVQLSSEWAFIRTSTHKKNSLTKREEAHEIFILNKTPENLWKIARYSGSSSL